MNLATEMGRLSGRATPSLQDDPSRQNNETGRRSTYLLPIAVQTNRATSCGKVQGIELLAHGAAHLTKARRLAFPQTLGRSLPTPGALCLCCGADGLPVVRSHRGLNVADRGQQPTHFRQDMISLCRIERDRFTLIGRCELDRTGGTCAALRAHEQGQQNEDCQQQDNNQAASGPAHAIYPLLRQQARIRGLPRASRLA